MEEAKTRAMRMVARVAITSNAIVVLMTIPAITMVMAKQSFPYLLLPFVVVVANVSAILCGYAICEILQEEHAKTKRGSRYQCGSKEAAPDRGDHASSDDDD